MTRLYFDVETYREGEAFDEKVIGIGVIVDKTRYSENSLNINDSNKVEAIIFSEKNLEEKEIIEKFYNLLKNTLKSSDFLNVVGFNILRYDIPLLIQKGVEFNISSHQKLNQLWHDTYTVDLFQIMLPSNGMRFKGNSLRNVVKKIKSKGYKIPEPYGQGEDVAEWYKRKEFDKIEKHLRHDIDIVRALDLAVLSRTRNW